MPPLTGHLTRFALAVPLLAALWWTAAMTAAAGATEHPAAPEWTARPAANGADRDGGRPYFYLEGLPGSVLQDRLSVTNPGPDPLTVRLRGADAYNTAKGGFAVRGAHGSTGTGAWLRTATDKVTVPARTRAEVPVSVTVPQDALPGDHPGAIVAESGGRSVGVRVQLRVGGPTLAALTVEDVRVSGGTIHYTLVNRGNAVLAPRLAVSADGVFGTLLRRDARTLPVELLPGQRVRLTEPWRDTPALDSATVRLRVSAGAARTARRRPPRSSSRGCRSPGARCCSWPGPPRARTPTGGGERHGATGTAPPAPGWPHPLTGNSTPTRGTW